MTSLLANPLLHRAVRRVRRKRLWLSWWPGRRPLHLLLAVVAAAMVGWGLASLGRAVEDDLPYAARDWLAMLIVLSGFGFPWLAPAFAVPAVAGEREAGSLDLLRVTPLGEGGIAVGQLMGVLVRLWPVVLALAVLTVLQAPWELWSESVLPDFLLPSGLGMGRRAAWALGGALLPWSHLVVNGALGLFASVDLRSLGAAVGATYVLLLIWRAALRLWVYVGLDSIPSWERGWYWALPLIEVFFEASSSALLVWGAAWRLGRE